MCRFFDKLTGFFYPFFLSFFLLTRQRHSSSFSHLFPYWRQDRPLLSSCPSLDFCAMDFEFAGISCLSHVWFTWMHAADVTGHVYCGSDCDLYRLLVKWPEKLQTLLSTQLTFGGSLKSGRTEEIHFSSLIDINKRLFLSFFLSFTETQEIKANAFSLAEFLSILHVVKSVNVVLILILRHSIYRYTGSLAQWVESLLMVRKTRVQSQVESYKRLKKCYLIPPCLTISIIRYVSRVKWNIPGKVVAPYSTPRCSSYWNRSLRVALDCSCQVYFLYIDIYVCVRVCVETLSLPINLA